MNTADGSTDYRKVLLYAHHGWGKTTQAVNYQREYGPGFIISGESGLGSIKSSGIDYLPFTSWDGEHDPAKGVYSFKGIIKIMNTPEFKARDYKWLMLDSLTELSDHAYKHAEEKANANPGKDGKINGFAIWEEYGAMMIGACKHIRDMKAHVIVTALAKESEDENGNIIHMPMIRGKAAQGQIPGIFDCVLCGVKRTSGSIDPTTGQASGMKTVHYIITDEIRGWRGKVRDEKRRLAAVESESDITKLFKKMEMPDTEYEAWLKIKTTEGGSK